MNPLPIFTVKEALLHTIASHQVVIVRGETGSGKTTQLPVFLYRAGFGKKGIITVAEPRRAAAINVADYVAHELGEPLGLSVGYRVRFESVGSRNTPLQFVTMGILLREILSDPKFLRHAVVVIDEVHESSTEGDLLVTLIREALASRPDFRVVLMSATLDVEKYRTYFGGAPVVDIPGRQHPVEVHYRESEMQSIQEVVEETVALVLTIDREKKDGDILVFMPGRESIEAVVESIAWRGGKHLLPLPLYKDLEPAEQMKAYRHVPGCRKVIVATNIAETSVTIENIKYVIDSGLIKNSVFCEKVGVQALLVESHSRSGCEQRSGRAGRTGPGMCYRMYTEASFKERPLNTVSEIERSQADGTVLYLEYLGAPVELLDLIHKPGTPIIQQARENLALLGALSLVGRRITHIGKRLAAMPVEPHIGRLILESVRFGCVREILTFVSFLSRTDMFIRPFGKESAAQKCHKPFLNLHSDALTVLAVWNAYTEAGYSRGWCREHFIDFHTMEEAKRVRDQLGKMLLAERIPITKAKNEERFLRCIISGLRFNVLFRNGNGMYRGIFRPVRDVYIFPRSPLRTSLPRYVVAAELLKTKHCYALYCTEANESWLKEYIPNLDSLVSITESDALLDEVPQTTLPKGKRRESVKIVAHPHLVTLDFTKDGKHYVAEYDGQRILKTNKGGAVSEGKPYRCQIVEILGVPFAEVVGEGAVEKPLPDPALNAMAEELALGWQCHFKKE